MLNTRLLLRIGVFLCIALFVTGMARLFWLRFEAGDLYPPYSSLRNDPLGIQALYESLQSLEDQDVSRNFRPLNQLDPAPRTTLVMCGLTDIPSVVDTPLATLLEKVTAGGGRLVISLVSSSSAPVDEKTDANDAVKPEKEDPEEKPSEEAPTLGLTLRGRTLEETHEDLAVRQEVRDAHLLPEALVFRSPLFLELDEPPWETVFLFEDEAVLARRAWGEGDVVIIADSYLFSNEALRNHRSPAFLTWVIGSDGPVLFDEYHHGLARQPGISALMRKYRLHGVVLSLAVVVALLIWQRAAVFAPRPADENESRADASETDTADGWVGLMRRHIAPGNLLAVCFEAWETSTAADKFSKEQIGQARNLITRQKKSRENRETVAVYRSICELLKRGKTP